MLGFFNKQKDVNKYLLSPLTGRVVSIREIPDDVFSEKILGDGVAILPSENSVVSPVDGEIVQVAETGHAFCVRSEDGLDILIHIGVDTIGLRGKGFKSFVSAGQKVKAGEAIGEADIEFIKQNEFFTHTAVLITNMHEVTSISFENGEVEAGKDKVINYVKV